MKIIIRNNSEAPLPYLLRCEGEKVGYIYYLNPGEELDCNALHTHKSGLVATTLYNAVLSISYEDFARLDISFVPRDK